jgi:uncharacterized membrane protein YebE (DUF533 family)
VPPAAPSSAVPPAASAGVPPEVGRLVRLAASAANADGTLSDAERQAIAAEAHRAGVPLPADELLQARRPLGGSWPGLSDAGGAISTCWRSHRPCR